MAARALGATKYSSLVVLWTLVFFAAPGFLFPVEQEVSRAVAARRAVGAGGGPVIRRAAVLALGLAAALAVISLATGRLMLDHLFDGQSLLLVALIVALPSYAAIHLGRGTFSGSARFGAYGWLLAGEGILRVGGVVALAIVGVKTAGVYGLLIALAPLAALLVIAAREHDDLLPPGPEAKWTELSANLWWLLAGSALAQGFVNVPVPIVKVLASNTEAAIAGQFQAGMIISRVPLFLFQAVQAALLPKLAGLAASGRFTDFRTGLKRLVWVVVGIGVAATIGAWLLGPFALRILFGPEFDKLGHADLGYLALASAAFMLAMALSQALIALEGHAKAALGWFVAIVVLAGVVATFHGLLFRVEMGLVIGAVVSVAAMALLLQLQMRTHAVPDTAEALVDAVSPEHEIIEP
ncbi:MAG TPA: hypothetical protein VHN98_04975 [Acidimicrobiales bacterium]|nr:hypothetical protein [Acidimicrobiales bacterium]